MDAFSWKRDENDGAGSKRTQRSRSQSPRASPKKQDVHLPVGELQKAIERADFQESNVKDNFYASIVDLDSDLRESISGYLDVVQWDALRRTCKSLREWPEPPPPSVAYHLVRFYLTDDRGRGRCGVSKTLGGVVDAYRHVLRSSIDWLWGSREVSVDVQFLLVADLGSPMLPLIRYSPSGGRRAEDGRAPARIHEYGILSVVEAGSEFPPSSAVRGMMSAELALHRGDRGLTADPAGGLALSWLGGLRPARDVDLRNLCFSRDDDEYDDGESHEIWLFRNRHGRTVGNEFQLGPNEEWAICD